MTAQLSSEDPMSHLHKAAATYAANGVAIFPVTPRDKTPMSGIKWRDESTADTDQIEQWWNRWPDANIGIDLAKNGKWALDIDGPTGKKQLDDWQTDYSTLPDTYQVATGRAEGSGRHWIFTQPDDDEPVRNTKLGPGIETRGEGGYVVAPPSIHPTGRPYMAFGRWTDIADAPNWIIALTRKARRPAEHPGLPATPDGRASKRLDGLAGRVAMAHEGNRSDVLNWAAYTAGRAISAGDLQRNDVEQILTEAATRSGHASDDGAGSVAATINSGLESGITAGPDPAQQQAALPAPPTAATLDTDQTNNNDDPPSALDEWISGSDAQTAIQAEAARLIVRQQAQQLVTTLEETRPMPAFVGLDNFLDRDYPPAQYRIDQLWPTDGRVLVAAQYKAGKTTMIANILRSLADGDDFLASYPVNQPARRIVLIDDELSERMLQQWLAEQHIANPQRISLVALRGRLSTFAITLPDIRTKWAQAIAALDADVVILDCLRPILDSLGLSEDKDAGKVLTAFDEMCEEAGVSEGVVVHHMGHMGERSRGDSRLRDWPDAEWKIVRQTQGDDGDDDPRATRFFSAIGRDVDVPEQQLGIDQAGRRLAVVGGSRKQATADAIIIALLDAVDADPGVPWKPLRTRAGVATGSRGVEVDRARDRALKEELIRRDIDGQTHRHYPTTRGRHVLETRQVPTPDTLEAATLQNPPQTATDSSVRGSGHAGHAGHGNDSQNLNVPKTTVSGGRDTPDTVVDNPVDKGVSRVYRNGTHHPTAPDTPPGHTEIPL